MAEFNRFSQFCTSIDSADFGTQLIEYFAYDNLFEPVIEFQKGL